MKKSGKKAEPKSQLKASSPIVVRDKREYLLAFLHGTVQSQSPLSKLRGQDSLLRIIWGVVCEEWIHLHIDRFPMHDSLLAIPELLPWDGSTGGETEYGATMRYPDSHKSSAGCPIAVVEKEISFPPLTSVPPKTFKNQESNALYVNMMPFHLRKEESLPLCCRQYYPLVQKCCRLLGYKNYSYDGEGGPVGYLTIDERPTPPGASQRRGGLHVESPGIMPLIQSNALTSEAEYSIETSPNVFVPGAEHHWGNGIMMRSEYVEGGIFMASNVAGTTAVWSCHINDEEGEFIGAHGDIEHMREALGPCARTLEAGELIWMTDRTPHESLPVPVSAENNVRRQYFRLVLGPVSAWFADHSTPNPIGIAPPPEVRIIRGNKFALYPSPRRKCCWYGGTPEQVEETKLFRNVAQKLCEYELGHLVQRAKQYGLTSRAEILRLYHKQGGSKNSRSVDWGPEYSRDGKGLFQDRGAYYHDCPKFDEMIQAWKLESTTKRFADP